MLKERKPENYFFFYVNFMLIIIEQKCIHNEVGHIVRFKQYFQKSL